jgi:hypothetical protein
MAKNKASDDTSSRLEALKDALDAAIALYGTTKEALAEFLEGLKSVDKELAGRIKGLTDKLGLLGDAIGPVLGGLIDGEKGAVAAILGVLAGIAVGTITFGVVALAPFAGAAVAGALLGGYTGWKVGNVVEDFLLDVFKKADQKPGSNLPNAPNKTPDSPTKSDRNGDGSVFQGYYLRTDIRGALP